MSKFRHSTLTVKSFDGNQLAGQSWLPENGALKHILVISHGLGEHSGRYTHVGEMFAAKGIGVYACDHRGHGNSFGKRGHIMSWSDYTRDLSLVEQFVREKHPDIPLALWGHSMGSLIALRFVETFPDNRFKALVVTGAPLELMVAVPAIKAKLGNFMSSVWPGLSLSNELDPSGVSRDADVVKKYIDDPLVHDRVSARWFTEFTAARGAVGGDVLKIKMPTLVMHGTADKMTDHIGSEKFHRLLDLPDTKKKYVAYKDWYHELHNEPEQQKPLDEISGWITKHCV